MTKTVEFLVCRGDDVSGPVYVMPPVTVEWPDRGQNESANRMKAFRMADEYAREMNPDAYAVGIKS